MRFSTPSPVLLVLSMTLVLGACSSNPYSLPKIESGQPSYEEPGSVSSPGPAPEVSAQEPAVPPVSAHGGLLAKASAARDRGEYDQALAYLERAQRIDPDDAGVYLAMAQTHDAAGDSAQARVTAERGLLYCSDSRQCQALKAYAR